MFGHSFGYPSAIKRSGAQNHVARRRVSTAVKLKMEVVCLVFDDVTLVEGNGWQHGCVIFHFFSECLQLPDLILDRRSLFG